MAREKFPSDDVDRLMVRFPPGMRDRLKKLAEANRRSMNAEIVARLESSFFSDTLLSAGGIEKGAAFSKTKVLQMLMAMHDAMAQVLPDQPGDATQPPELCDEHAEIAKRRKLKGRRNLDLGDETTS